MPGVLQKVIQVEAILGAMMIYALGQLLLSKLGTRNL